MMKVLKLMAVTAAVLFTAVSGTFAQTTLSGGWSYTTIGNQTATVTLTSGEFSIDTKGGDMVSSVDQCVFTYQMLSGDGEITARFTDPGLGHKSFTKTGLMIRKSLDDTSAMAYLYALVDGGQDSLVKKGFTYVRNVDGGLSGRKQTANNFLRLLTFPTYFKLKRTGDLIETFFSADSGATWQKASESDSVADYTAVLGTNVYVGIFAAGNTLGDSTLTITGIKYDNVVTTFSAAPIWQTGPVQSPIRLLGESANPFNDLTEIFFNLPNAAGVDVSVYDISGNKVSTLLNGSLRAGSHSVDWNAAGLKPAVYYYKIQSNDFVQSRQLILLNK